MLRDLYKKLGHVYATEKDTSEARRLKKEIIEQFKNDVKINYDSLFMTKNFKGIPEIKINNAHLAIRMTYTLDLKLYDDFRNEEGYDLKQFIGYVKTLKKVKEPKREIQKELEK
jgi:predicted aminopeptidase